MKNSDKQYQLEILDMHKADILVSLSKMQEILSFYFPEQYADAYQHWIPQIYTALMTNSKWLDRGTFSFEDTIKSIVSKQNLNGSGIKKVV
jgi:hypothetical protein